MVMALKQSRLHPLHQLVLLIEHKADKAVDHGHSIFLYSALSCPVAAVPLELINWNVVYLAVVVVRHCFLMKEKGYVPRSPAFPCHWTNQRFPLQLERCYLMVESVAHTQRRPGGIFFYSCHRLERFPCFLLDAKGIGCCVEGEEAQGSLLVDLMNG
jgi:hypothetical protein